MFVGDGRPGGARAPGPARSWTSPGRASGSTPTSGPRAATARWCARVESYEAYWDRWAEPWEFQALLKARPVAGDADLGAPVRRAAPAAGCGPGRSAPTTCARCAHMKRRAEAELARRGLTDREVKRGRAASATSSSPCSCCSSCTAALDPDAAVARPPSRRWPSWPAPGYVDPDDAEPARPTPTGSCAGVEHRLQLVRRARRSTPCPTDDAARDRLARVARLPRHGRRRRRSSSSTRELRPPPGHRARHPRARSTSGRCSRPSPAADARAAGQPGRGRGPAAALRLHRRRAHPGRRARADPRPHPARPG